MGAAGLAVSIGCTECAECRTASYDAGTMTDEFLYRTSEWVIQLAFLASLLTGIEGGFRLGRRVQSTTSEKAKGQNSVIAGSILGVAGLLLGFTISMSVTRFEVRKQLVLEEANAIGTSYLRTQLLPRPEGGEIANLLSEYVDARVQFVDAGRDMYGMKNARAEALRLQKEFWSRAAAYGQADPNPVRSGLLLQSLNEVIDLESARWMAFHNHVPETVIYVNLIVAILSANMVGFFFGLEGRRHIFASCLLTLAVAAVLAVIIDLDRPSEGFIQVGQQPMIDLQQQLRAAKARASRSF
jgi:hypothetical protein